LGLFNRLLIESKDGSELERIDNVNLYSRAKLYSQTAENYISANGLSMGIMNNSATLYGVDVVTIQQFSIPLWVLCGIFDSNILLPPMLTSGLRIRLSLSPLGRVVISNAGGASTAVQYSITSPRIIVDSIELTPLIERKLLELSGNGLEFCYKTAFYTASQAVASGGPNVVSSINFEINKSVSRAVSVIFFLQNATRVIENAIGLNDINGTTQNVISQYQLRLGDIYLPQQPLRTNVLPVTNIGSQDLTEFYAQLVLYGNNKYCYSYDPPAITYQQYNTNYAVAPFVGVANLYNDQKVYNTQTLERSPTLQASGMSINNSRTLVLNTQYTMPSATAASFVLVTFLEYLKLAKIFPRNVAVKE